MYGALRIMFAVRQFLIGCYVKLSIENNKQNENENRKKKDIHTYPHTYMPCYNTLIFFAPFDFFVQILHKSRGSAVLKRFNLRNPPKQVLKRSSPIAVCNMENIAAV